MGRIRREPAVERLPVERLVAVPVVLGGRDERDDTHAGRLRALDGLRQPQPPPGRRCAPPGPSPPPSSGRSEEPCSSGSGGSGQVRQYGSPTARSGAAG